MLLIDELIQNDQGLPLFYEWSSNVTNVGAFDELTKNVCVALTCPLCI